MSQRERWIVYPLLFFSFALAIRDQWPTRDAPPEFDVLNCRHLVVRDENGQPAVDIRADRGSQNPDSPNRGSGAIVIFGNAPQVGGAKPAALKLFVTERQNGVVETYGPLGSRAVKAWSDATGGHVLIFDAVGKPQGLHRVAKNTPARGTPPDPSDVEDDPRQANPRPPVPPAGEASDAKREDAPQ